MKKLNYPLVFVVLSVFLFATFVVSCKSTKNTTSMTNIKFTDTLKTKAGEDFKIELKSNPSTGFTWNFDEKSLDKKIVKFDKNEYVPPKDTKLIGAAGKEIWNFKAVAKGEAVIVLTYARQWNTANANINEIRVFKIVVE